MKAPRPPIKLLCAKAAHLKLDTLDVSISPSGVFIECEQKPDPHNLYQYTNRVTINPDDFEKIARAYWLWRGMTWPPDQEL